MIVECCSFFVNGTKIGSLFSLDIGFGFWVHSFVDMLLENYSRLLLQFSLLQDDNFIARQQLLQPCNEKVLGTHVRVATNADC